MGQEYFSPYSSQVPGLVGKVLWNEYRRQRVSEKHAVSWIGIAHHTAQVISGTMKFKAGLSCITLLIIFSVSVKQL